MFDLLEKGLREPDENDWMMAYGIEGHPELHLSHHYFRGLSEDQAQQLVGMLKDHFAKKPLQAKPINLSQEEQFGPDKDIRVLVNDELAPHLDPELKTKLNEMYPSRFPQYRPHVTTNEHQNVNGNISHYYFQRGNGQTYFQTHATGSPSNSQNRLKTSDSTNKPLEKANKMPNVNAKVEGIEVKRSQSGITPQPTAVKGMPTPSTTAKVPVPPKPSAMTGKMNNMPQQPSAPKAPPDLQKAEPISKDPKEPNKIDYSKFLRPTYSNTGSKAPIHNPIQHSEGALTGMERKLKKNENDCVSQEYMAKTVQILRKCMGSKLGKADSSGKNATDVYMRG